MSQHDYLKERYNQHIIKNNYSKIDDENAKEASETLILILKDLFPEHNFELKSYLYFSEIEKYTERNFNLNYNYANRKLAPDGGIIWMDKKYPILISEMKRQGTNNERVAEGKNKQAVGNAIERLGKNLIGFKTLYEKEDILPFVCFCWGCDVTDGTFLGKLYTLNSFYEINVIYNKNENIINKPFTCITKESGPFTREELLNTMLKIAINSIKYFEKKEGK